MKQMKTCGGAHFVILLTTMLASCGNKGPLVRPQPLPDTAPIAEMFDGETEQKEPKK